MIISLIALPRESEREKQKQREHEKKKQTRRCANLPASHHYHYRTSQRSTARRALQDKRLNSIPTHCSQSKNRDVHVCLYMLLRACVCFIYIFLYMYMRARVPHSPSRCIRKKREKKKVKRDAPRRARDEKRKILSRSTTFHFSLSVSLLPFFLYWFVMLLLLILLLLILLYYYIIFRRIQLNCS